MDKSPKTRASANKTGNISRHEKPRIMKGKKNVETAKRLGNDKKLAPPRRKKVKEEHDSYSDPDYEDEALEDEEEIAKDEGSAAVQEDNQKGWPVSIGFFKEYVNHYYDYEQKKRAKNDKKEGSSAGSTTMDIEDKQNEAFDEKPLLQIWEEYDVQKKFLTLSDGEKHMETFVYKSSLMKLMPFGSIIRLLDFHLVKYRTKKQLMINDFEPVWMPDISKLEESKSYEAQPLMKIASLENNQQVDLVKKLKAISEEQKQIDRQSLTVAVGEENLIILLLPKNRTRMSTPVAQPIEIDLQTINKYVTEAIEKLTANRVEGATIYEIIGHIIVHHANTDLVGVTASRILDAVLSMFSNIAISVNSLHQLRINVTHGQANITSSNTLQSAKAPVQNVGPQNVPQIRQKNVDQSKAQNTITSQQTNRKRPIVDNSHTHTHKPAMSTCASFSNASVNSDHQYNKTDPKLSAVQQKQATPINHIIVHSSLNNNNTFSTSAPGPSTSSSVPTRFLAPHAVNMLRPNLTYFPPELPVRAALMPQRFRTVQPNTSNSASKDSGQIAKDAPTVTVKVEPKSELDAAQLNTEQRHGGT